MGARPGAVAEAALDVELDGSDALGARHLELEGPILGGGLLDPEENQRTLDRPVGGGRSRTSGIWPSGGTSAPGSRVNGLSMSSWMKISPRVSTIFSG